MIENILQYFFKEWPVYYYLADFILSHLLNYPDFYYNYNCPDWFSLEGKNGRMFYLFDFITCVANTSDKFILKESYKELVTLLIKNGAPVILFKDWYYLKSDSV